MSYTNINLIKETCESKLRDLLDSYRDNMKRKITDPDMHRTLCCFLRLELEFFLKFKKFIDAIPEDGATLPTRSSGLAEDLREGYPLAMFNESLMDFFDACMARSEGTVKDVTIFTKSKYKQLEGWHSMFI